MTLQAALVELLDRLLSTVSGSPGAQRVGADAAPGTPHGLGPGTVDSQFSQLLACLNAHVGAVTGAHSASPIAALPHQHISAVSVRGRSRKPSTTSSPRTRASAGRRWAAGRSAAPPYTLANGTARTQLSSLLGSLNAHVSSGDHDGRSWRRVETLSNADMVDGPHASAFALAGHNHDVRSMRRVFLRSEFYDPGQSRLVTTLPDRPDLVTYAYNYLTSRLPRATTYIRGVRVRLDDAVLAAVREVHQVTVEELKAASADGKLTPEERVRLKQIAIDTVRSLLGKRGLGEFAKVLGLGDGAVDKLLAMRVEAAVHDLKRTRANHMNGASGPKAELPFAA